MKYTKKFKAMKTETKNRIKNNLLGLLYAFAFFGMFAISLTSCNKEPQPQPQGKEIQVQVKTEGLLIKEMTKSFDPSQWVYNYNPNAYELKFQGVNNTYTFSKTIQELQTGFQVSVLPDTYIITYESIHNPITGNAPLDDKLDISINESKSIITSSDLTLNAENQDYMVVFESTLGNPIIWYINPNNQTNNSLSFFNSPEPNNQTYKYMYWNQEGNILITYNGMEKTIPNATKGNVYHIVSGVNGNSTVNITPMNYNIIGW